MKLAPSRTDSSDPLPSAPPEPPEMAAARAALGTPGEDLGHTEAALTAMEIENRPQLAAQLARGGEPSLSAWLPQGPARPAPPPPRDRVIAMWAERRNSQDIKLFIKHLVDRGNTTALGVTLTSLRQPWIANTALLAACAKGDTDLAEQLIPQVFGEHDVDHALSMATMIGAREFTAAVVDWAKNAGRQDIAQALASHLQRTAPEQDARPELPQDLVDQVAQIAHNKDHERITKLLDRGLRHDHESGLRLLLSGVSEADFAPRLLREAKAQGKHALIKRLIPDLMKNADPKSATDLIRTTGTPDFASAVFDWAQRQGRHDIAAAATPFTSPFAWLNPSPGEIIESRMIDLMNCGDPEAIPQLTAEIKTLLAQNPQADNANLVLRLNQLIDHAFDLDDSPHGRLLSESIGELLTSSALPPSPRAAHLAIVLGAFHGDVAMLNKLVAAGFNLDQKNPLGITPLAGSAWHGDALAVEALLAAGADIDARSVGDYTPLHVAAGLGFEGIVKLLLEHGADRNAKTDSPAGRFSAATIARACGFSSCAQQLAHTPNSSSNTPDIDLQQLKLELEFFRNG